MGSCLSKKGEINPTAVVSSAAKSVSLPAVKAADAAPEKTQLKTEQRKTEQKKTEDDESVKKEVFVIKHRKSNDKQMQQEKKQNIEINQSRVDSIAIGTPVRTSSCTREEVDAILIQCGRLSRSSSANTPSKKKYSGSKRSYDFDAEGNVSKDEEDELEKRRQSRRSSPSKPGRRRTPSRERDSSQQRSGSRERSVAGSGRRVSRSPGRRSDTPVGSGVDVSNGVTRPGKLVSVPASVTTSIGAGNEQGAVKRIGVKRDVRSPRSQSPAQTRQPPLTLSRSNSRKTDQSPCRRNPLTEIDNNHSSQALRRPGQNHQGAEEGANRSLSNKRGAAVAKVETKVVQQKASHADTLQPKLNRTKSLSRSRDFDELNRGPNPNSNPNASSYASILLEDIQTFHQKSSNNNVAFSLPQCVTNACSIMDAVADLNSTTSSLVASNDEKKRGERLKFDPFVETALAVTDDLMEPSLHKYVTMTRGGNGGDMGDEESSGSNSVAGGGQPRWGSPSEPNSVESTGCLTSKVSKQRPFEPSRIQIRS